MAKLTYKDVKAEELEAVDKLAQGLVEYASKRNIPLSIVEGALKDVLAQIESHRLLEALRNRGAKI